MVNMRDLLKGFQPTYEELKHDDDITVSHSAGVFSAYLRGIETITPPVEIQLNGKFSAYLRGIETFN